MIAARSATSLCVSDLGDIALAVADRAGTRVSDGPVAIRSVRLKPRRNLTVSFGARASTGADRPLLTVTVGADRVQGAHLLFDGRQAGLASVHVLAPGVFNAPELDLTAQVFPADASLPTLAGCFETSPERSLFACLQSAARVLLGDDRWTLASATTEPLRYKPGSRCVLAYHLQGKDGRRLEVIGKLYADPAQAEQVQRSLARLHFQLGDRASIIPIPLGVAARLGIAWMEAVPQPPRSPSSRAPLLSEGAVKWAGRALASLHATCVPAGSLADWTAGDEAGRVEERGFRLAAWQSGQAAAISRLSEALARRLENLPAEERVVSHGAFKRSQLILEGHRRVITDFDALCLADPGLDVGCFLAYLRPAGVFRGRQSSIEWFAGAGLRFARSYWAAARAQGRTQEAVAGTLEHARLFEASRLLKIAARRIGRLNSPRPSELSAICGEIAECMDNPTRWTCAR